MTMRATLQRVTARTASRTSERRVSISNRPGLQNGVQKIQRQVGNKATARLLGSRGNLTYREATELAKCVHIMGEESEAYCREVVLGEQEASTPTGPQVPRIFRIVLANLGAARAGRDGIQQTVREAFAPLAAAAGRELELGFSLPGDVQLNFETGGFESSPCTGILILGNEGGGEIFIGAHLDLRVCGIPERIPDPTGTHLTDEIDYASTIQRVFDESDPEFGRFVGNTAVHEAAHIIASLEHSSIRSNYMFAVGSTGANLPRAERTLTSMRLHWAGIKSFTSGQTSLLVAAIRSGQYSGGMQIHTPSPTTPPVPTRRRGSQRRPPPKP